MGIWRKLSCQEKSNTELVWRGWRKKVFGQLWEEGSCAAKKLMGPGHLSSRQLETRLWGEGPELLKGRVSRNPKYASV